MNKFTVTGQDGDKWLLAKYNTKKIPQQFAKGLSLIRNEH